MSPQTIGGKQLVFGSWSDNGAATRTVAIGDTDWTHSITYVEADNGAGVIHGGV